MEMGKQVPMTLWIDDHPSTAGCLRQILEQPVAVASSKGQPRKGLTIGRYKRPDDLGNRWIFWKISGFFFVTENPNLLCTGKAVLRHFGRENPFVPQLVTFSGRLV